MAALAVSACPVVAMRPVALSKASTQASKPAFVANRSVKKTEAMLVWTPINNKFFETFSFLPALTNEQISKQVDYFVNNSWTPCLEFAPSNQAYVSDESTIRFGPVASGYQDNRYWTMWKLPMFGCSDGSQVLKEIAACTKAFPDSYIRLVAFDNVKQVQIAGFLVHRPANVKEFCAPDKRSV